MALASVNNKVIVEAILSGVADARRTYAAWTRNVGYFAWAPEYLITVSVAQAVWEWCAPVTVWPEYRLGDAMREAGPRRFQLPDSLDGNRRVDLLLYGGGPHPHAIVEVKRNVEGWAKIAGDVERLRLMLASPNNSFELGVVAFSCTQMAGRGAKGARGAAMVKDRLLRMTDNAEDVVLPGWRCGMVSRGINYDGHEHWTAAAVVLEKQRVGAPEKLCDGPCESRGRQVPSPS